jgi:hypothetical protein
MGKVPRPSCLPFRAPALAVSPVVGRPRERGRPPVAPCGKRARAATSHAPHRARAGPRWPSRLPARALRPPQTQGQALATPRPGPGCWRPPGAVFARAVARGKRKCTHRARAGRPWPSRLHARALLPPQNPRPSPGNTTPRAAGYRWWLVAVCAVRKNLFTRK